MKAFLILVIAVAAAAESPDAGNGKKLYAKDGCYECHGYAGQGSRDGPRIAATSLTLQAVLRYVRRPLGAMPAFTAKVLSDQELSDIYAYLKSLAPAKPAKEIPLLDKLRDK